MADLVQYHIFKVELISGSTIQNITNLINKITIDLALNSIYNTVRIELKDNEVIRPLGKEVKITYNTLTTTAFIIERTKKDNNLTTLYCRTIGAKFYRPFISDINLVDNAIDTNELITKYSNIAGVEIENHLPPIQLNGAFERGGEVGDALQKILNIFKAEIYEKNTELVIKPTKIQDNNTTNIIDFYEDTSISTKDSIQTKGIGTVIISNDSEKIIESCIVADIYEDTGEVRLFTIEEHFELLEGGSRGLTKPFITLYDTYNQVAILNNNNYFELERYAVEVLELTVNGASVDYELKGKAVEFKENLRGVLSISYKSKYKKSYLIPRIINNKKYGDIEVLVSDDYLSWFGELMTTVDNGNIDYEVVGEPCTNVGFDIYIYNDTLPKILLYKGALLQDTSGKISIEENVEVDKLEDITLSLNENNNKYEAQLKYKNATVKKVRVGMQEFGDYTTEARDGFTYIQFNDMYYSVDILYTITSYKVHIQYTPDLSYEVQEYLVLVDNNYNTVININGDNCQFVDCTYPHTHTFNIAKILDVPIKSVVGKSIDGLGTINEFGEVSKTYNADGIFTYNTNDIKPRTKIIFKANVNGTAGDTNNNSFSISGGSNG